VIQSALPAVAAAGAATGAAFAAGAAAEAGAMSPAASATDVRTQATAFVFNSFPSAA
jgi:hypothetical protein